jgi:hypothetical protein
LEGKVQLKHFFKNQSKKLIHCSQIKNDAAFVPVSETSFAKDGKFLTAFLVGLKMAARKGGKENFPPHPPAFKMYPVPNVFLSGVPHIVCSSPYL